MCVCVCVCVSVCKSEIKGNREGEYLRVHAFCVCLCVSNSGCTSAHLPPPRHLKLHILVYYLTFRSAASEAWNSGLVAATSPAHQDSSLAQQSAVSHTLSQMRWIRDECGRTRAYTTVCVSMCTCSCIHEFLSVCVVVPTTAEIIGRQFLVITFFSCRCCLSGVSAGDIHFVFASLMLLVVVATAVAILPSVDRVGPGRRGPSCPCKYCPFNLFKS
jgi:hypothetical protein